MPQISSQVTPQSRSTPLQKIKTQEFFIGPKIRVTEDKKSKSRIINFPFDFPDDTKGCIIILRLADEEWTPSNDITKITLDMK
jgi:hypothetical protein